MRTYLIYADRENEEWFNGLVALVIYRKDCAVDAIVQFKQDFPKPVLDGGTFRVVEIDTALALPINITRQLEGTAK